MSYQSAAPIWVIAFLLTTTSGFSQNFSRQYGNAFDNAFSKVLKSGANYFVVGRDQASAGALSQATVTRLNANGVLQWTRRLDIASVWNDAILTSNGSLLLVGHTLPADATNKSIIGLITAAGVFTYVNTYDAPGRESLLRIVRNPVPQSASFPYYVVGLQAQAGAATVDDVILINMSETAGFNWKKLYSSSANDQFYRDFEALSNGDLILSGAYGNSVIFRADNVGNMIGGATTGSLGTFNDVYPRSTGGGFYAVGSGGVAPNIQVYLVKFDNDLINLWETRISGLTAVSQVWEDAPNGWIYVVGTGIFNGKSRAIVIRLIETGDEATQEWAKFLDNGETLYNGGSAWRLSNTQMAFVDGRIPITGGFGQLCAFLSVNDLEMATCITMEGSIGTDKVSLIFDGPVGPNISFYDTPQAAAVANTGITWQQADVCSSAPCVAAFTSAAVGACGNFQFTNQSSGPIPPPLTYAWNFGDPNSGANNTSTATNPTHQFNKCGTYNVCLTVTGAGCTASVCHPVVVTDNVLPTAVCKPGVGVTLNANCSYTVTTGFVDGGSSDNCPNWSLSVSPTTLTGCDNHTVTLTVTDWCGNTKTCTMGIQTTEAVPPVITNCPLKNTTTTNFGQCYYSGSPYLIMTSDNCDPNPTITCTTTDAQGNMIIITPETQFEKGSRTIRCEAEDKCGNKSAPCSFIFEVVDGWPPTITCPQSLSVTGSFNPQGQCKAVVNGLAPTASDNCPMLAVAYTISAPTGGTGANDASGTNFMQGASTVTYTATDMGGNKATCSFVATVECVAVCSCFQFNVVQNPDNLCQFDVSMTRISACNIDGPVNEVDFFVTDTSAQFSGVLTDSSVVAVLNPEQTEAYFTTNFDLRTIPQDVSIAIGSFTVETKDGIAKFNASVSGPPPVGNVCTFGDYIFGVSCKNFTPPPPIQSKIYSGPDDNYPTKIKGFNGFTYLLGSRRDANGVEHATFSKFTGGSNNFGTLVWDYQLSFPSLLLDFEYSPTDGSFLLVGRTEPFQVGGTAQDNQSLLVKIRDNGSTASLVHARQYFHTGRESFTRIVRQTVEPVFQYYIVGHKNPGLPASGTDLVMMYNVDKDCNSRWANEYNSPNEVEGHYGLFPRANGNVVILGAQGPLNDAVLAEINGTNGNVVGAYRYNNVNNNAKWDFNDGLELPSGDLAIVGEDLTNGASSYGILLRLNSAFLPLVARTLTDFSELTEIGRDNNSNGISDLLYMVGPKTGTPDYPCVTRIGTTATSFNAVWSAYYKWTETDFKNGHFSVTPNYQRIFYADSRQILGNWDIFAGSFTLNFGNPFIPGCFNKFTPTLVPFTPRQNTIQLVPKSLTQNFNNVTDLVDLPMTCTEFCKNSCWASFTCTQGACQNVQCTGMGGSNGAGPVFYQWLLNGCGAQGTLLASGTLTSSGAPLNVSLPVGTHTLCFQVTDPSLPCSTCICQTITILPAAKPTCSAPANVTLNTDPGKCTATGPYTVSGTGCGPMSIFMNCPGFTDSDFGPGNSVSISGSYTFNKGVNVCTVTVTDGLNQTANCAFTVTVVDNEKPKIICPQNVFVPNVPLCNGGAAVTYLPPTVTDNCPMVTYACSPPSGSFFPCGTTTVTCIATDMAPAFNTASCTFTVTVACVCATIGMASIICDPLVDDKYIFTIPVNVLSGGSGCTYAVSGTIPGGTVMQTSLPGVNPIVGMITMNTNVIPTTFNLTVTVNCICPNGQPVSCTLPVALTPVCCKKIKIDNKTVCSTDQTVSIPISMGCGLFNMVQLVNWYVATGPTCPPCPTIPCSQGNGWFLQQTTAGANACNTPLVLCPYLYSNNIWIVAVMTVGDFPCHVVQSNIACITRCEPVKCMVTPVFSEYCYLGTPIPVPTLTAMPTPPNSLTCPSIFGNWTLDGNSIGFAGQTVINPASLSLNDPLHPCFKDFVYTATVSNVCGAKTCSATVRLDDHAASIGTLDMNPLEPLPYCPGEDFVMCFKDKCTTPLPPPPTPVPTWNWCVSTVGSSGPFSPLSGAGSMNPKWWTNPLTADHWYQVKATNGACPPKQETYFIDICDPLSIGTFTAVPVMNTPDCFIQGLDLAVPFQNPCCPVTVTWIKNGNVISGPTTYASSSATFFYTDPLLLGDYSGNYWCIVESTCCKEKQVSNLVTIDPPCFAFIKQLNCVAKKNMPVTLWGMVMNPKPFVQCDDYWFMLDPLGGPDIFISSNTHISVQAAGSYVYKVFCDDGCIKCDTVKVIFCNNNCDPVYKCCEDVDLFAEVVKNAVDITLDTALCKVVLRIGNLPGCDFLDKITWGDGNETTGHWVLGDSVVHFYTDNGSYTISYHAIEQDSMAETCFQRTVSQTVKDVCGVCTCGGGFDHGFFNTSFGPVSGGGNVAVTCGGVLSFPCQPGTNYMFNGQFYCQGACAGAPVIKWELFQIVGGINPLSLVDAGVVTTSLNNFNIPLNSGYFYVLGGAYQLNLTGHCGLDDCVCSYVFVSTQPCPPICPCDVTQLQNDVAKGFGTSQTLGSCKMCFIPKALNPCDMVTWTISGVTPNPYANTIGRQAACFTFPSSGGVYTITMTVTRKKGVNSICGTYSFQRTLSLTCSPQPIGCTGGRLFNPGFDTLAKTGILEMGGDAAHWKKVAGAPRVDSIPSINSWVMTLSGNSQTFDVIRYSEEVCLEKGKGTISLQLRSINVDGLPVKPKPGERLVVQFVRGGVFLPGTCTDPDCFEVANLELPNDEILDWSVVDIDYDLSDILAEDPCSSPPTSSLKVRPVIYLTNSLANEDSRLQLDIFCLQGKGFVLGSSVPFDKSSLRIFPNPNTGEFTVELAEAATPGMVFKITDTAGRLVLQKTTDTGSARQIVRATGLPEGMYFLQVVTEGKVTAIGRFVRQ